MRLEPFLQCLVLAAVTAQPSAGMPTGGFSGPGGPTAGPTPALSPSPALPQLIVTRHLLFAIPFSLEPSAEASRKVIEVQLYVSSDRGAHWQLYSKVPPNQQRFVFRTASDGEYWFVIRTLDSAGRLRPETIGPPGLRVRVDTHPPKLTLAARLIPPRQVSVGWEVDKSSLRPESLSIQYRSLPNGPWQVVVLNPPGSTPSNTAVRGEAVIPLRPGEAIIQIRAEVADTAGNMGFAHAEVRADQPVSTWPPATTVAQPPRAFQTPPPAAPTAPPAWSALAQPAAQSPRAGVLATGDSRSWEPKGSVAISISPAIGRQLPAAGESPSLAPSIPGMPNGEHPRMVNSRLFELEYDVDAVGPSGIGRVELWGTHDGGQTWRKYEAAQQRGNTLLVTVEDEGVYGFRVLVTNGAGIGPKPPKRGDLPDLWVGVDLTKPTARIVSARQGVDSEAGRLIITWQADDNMLAARPISLLYSQERGGPWMPIASGLENLSRYSWPIDEHTPTRMYLRLEARDEAGNLGIYETPEPVTIDRSPPSVHIRDVRSLLPPAAAPSPGDFSQRRVSPLRGE